MTSSHAGGRGPHRYTLVRPSQLSLQWLRIVALTIGGVSVLAFLVLALYQGIPRSIDGDNWEVAAQLVALAVAALGYLIAWRWEAVGGAVLVIGGVALGVLASIQYPPLVALLAALAFVVPAMLLGLRWQWRSGVIPLVVTSTFVSFALLAGALLSFRTYNGLYGASHPSSPTKLPPADVVDWIWAGGQTAESFMVKARLRGTPEQAELLVGISESLQDARPFPGRRIAGAPNDPLFEFVATGLQPGTTYRYAVRTGNRTDTGRVGTLRTFAPGPQSFTFAIGSCMRTGSNGQVFDRIREANPLFFLVDGDFTYDNLATNDPTDFLNSYERNLRQPAQQALFLGTGFVYTWDDHDYGGNDSDAAATSRTAARTAYREFVPHHELVASGGAIFHAFTVGRVRFLVTDVRSDRTRDPAGGGPGTMLGLEQKAWLKRQMQDANGKFPLIIWVNSVPWITPAAAGGDNWGGFADERAELAQFIADEGIKGVAMISGDAHMLAIDDGSHSDYSANGGAAFPVFHAAALDRPGSVKGGPYSEGAYPGGGQFGLMTVDDDGGPSLIVTWSARNWEGAELIHYEFSVPAGATR